MKKNTLVIAAVACAGLALGACQQKAVEETKETTTTTTTVPAENQPAVAPATDATQPAGHSMNEQEHNMNLAADTQMPAQANDAANTPAADASVATTSATISCAEGDTKCLEEQKAKANATTSSSTTTTTTTTQQ